MLRTATFAISSRAPIFTPSTTLPAYEVSGIAKVVVRNGAYTASWFSLDRLLVVFLPGLKHLTIELWDFTEELPVTAFLADQFASGRAVSPKGRHLVLQSNRPNSRLVYLHPPQKLWVFRVLREQLQLSPDSPGLKLLFRMDLTHVREGSSVYGGGRSPGSTLCMVGH